MRNTQARRVGMVSLEREDLPRVGICSIVLDLPGMGICSIELDLPGMGICSIVLDFAREGGLAWIDSPAWVGRRLKSSLERGR
jgi:hypothetical protein